MFFRRVNLTGPKGEKLQSWVAEKYADIGTVFRLVEDEKMRAWTVSEAGEQLMMDTQIDPRHVVNPIDPIDADNLRPLHGALNGGHKPDEKKPRRPRAQKNETVDVQ